MSNVSFFEALQPLGGAGPKSRNRQGSAALCSFRQHIPARSRDHLRCRFARQNLDRFKHQPQTSKTVLAL